MVKRDNATPKILMLVFVTLIGLAISATSASAQLQPVSCQAGSFYGNCNADFGTNTIPAYVDTETSITTTLNWTKTNAISIQYNPDAYAVYQDCKQGLNSCNWVQAGYIVDQNGCYDFTIQVYNILTGDIVFLWEPEPYSCESFSGAQAGVHVFINENVGSNKYISSITFTIEYFIGTYPHLILVYKYNVSVSVPQSTSNYWYKSDLVILGTNYGNAQFHSGSGAFAYDSNVPIYMSTVNETYTGEQSNMIYGCPIQEDLYLYAQTFGQTQC